MGDPLLEVTDLRTWFRTEDGVVRAVDGVSYTVDRGRALGIIGESGSGKTVSARTLLGLLPSSAEVVGGKAIFEGRDLLGMSERELCRIRGRRIGMVFQNAIDAMNPTLTLRRQLTEHLVWHGICGRQEATHRAIEVLADVGIPEPDRVIQMYPFQLSGGMRQRAMIATAVVTAPVLLIADEPTTAVDVTVQRQVLDLFARLKQRGMSIIMITHDLGVARYLCDDVVIMYAGRVMERGPMRDFLARPRHPYSRGLLTSTLELGDTRARLTPIPGNPPDLARRPVGCPFHPRCEFAEPPRCTEDQVLTDVGTHRTVACWKVATGAV